MNERMHPAGRAATTRLGPASVAVRFVLAGLILSSTSPAWACYAVIVGRKASADGSVLVGHNEENAGRRVLYFTRIPRRRYPAGSQVRLLRGGSLPQVSQTWSFLWSENPGLEFSDGYLNEHGVVIVSDACPSREDDYHTLVARGEIRNGGIGYMLRRLVAERATSAREGVELAGRLIEQFGYVASGRTYVIADPKEAWLLAVVRGRRWVARRVPDDAVVVLPNVYIIDEVSLDDRESFLGSADLISYAVRRGWFDPDHEAPFSFRRVYGHPGLAEPDPRRLRGRQLITGRPASTIDSLGVKPARKMTVADVATILRDRAGTRHISSPFVQEGAVFQLRSNMPPEIGCVWWRTTAQPATSVLTPWYLGVNTTSPSYDRAVDVATRTSLEYHFNPPPGTFEPRGKLAWWTFRRLQYLANKAGEDAIRQVQQKWQARESALFEKQPSMEQRLLELWKTDPDQARRQITVYCSTVAEQAMHEVEKLISQLEGH